jgi:hypothetical protein
VLPPHARETLGTTLGTTLSTMLDEHARRFPRGALASERRGLRILALCELGDVAGARRDAAAFLASHPPTGLAERVERSCAGQSEE